MGHPMEYNLNQENKLRIGDKLKDDKNQYVVVEMDYSNTHSQYASKVMVHCVKGPHKGRQMWIDHYLASQYKQ